jgi:rhodanese-related sulfurtransferase
MGTLALAIANPTKDDFNSPSTKTSSFTDIQTAVKNGAHLYDVRTPDEYAAGHFARATNFPLQNMQANKLPPVNKTAKIYVYCHSGNRATQATTILKQNGYTNVTNLGGATAVESMGGKLITE